MAATPGRRLRAAGADGRLWDLDRYSKQRLLATTPNDGYSGGSGWSVLGDCFGILGIVLQIVLEIALEIVLKVSSRLVGRWLGGRNGFFDGTWLAESGWWNLVRIERRSISGLSGN